MILEDCLIDYVNIIRDWLELDTNNMFTLYYIQKDNNKIDVDEDIIYFSYKLKNKSSIEEIYNLSRNWLKKKEFRDLYYDRIHFFDDEIEGPIFLSLSQ